MNKPIYIAAYHQSKFGKLMGLSIPEIVSKSVTEVCGEIKVEPSIIDVGSIGAACNFSLNEQGLLAGLMAMVPGMQGKPIEAVENACATGGQAIISVIHKLQLGLGDIQQLDLRELAWGQIQAGTKLGKVEPVFPRADKSMIERMQHMEQQRSTQGEPKPTEAEQQPAETGAKAPAIQAAAASPISGAEGAQSSSPVGAPPSSPASGDSVGTSDKITIDDFLKVELRDGEVKVAEKVKGADKLLRMEVDIGGETRQIVAGIAKAYEPEKLIGRKVVIVANLQPRKLRGLESNGMIVAASIGDDGLPVLAGFLEDVPVGAKLK